MKKLKKPRSYEFDVPVTPYKGGEEIHFSHMPIRDLERLHKWLGKVLAWRNQNKGKHNKAHDEWCWCAKCWRPDR